MFARMRLTPGSQEYQEYYARHPDKQAEDDRLRAQPGLLSPQSSLFEAEPAAQIKATFPSVADLQSLSAPTPASQPTGLDPKTISGSLKVTAQTSGAILAGITEITAADYYTHRGRGSHYGTAIQEHHRWAVVFAVEMDRQRVCQAPALAATVASSQGYLRAAVIGRVLMHAIAQAGYGSYHHMDADYLLPLPFLAERAGLGQIGRMGILITRQFGARVRLGAVTTNLPLAADQPTDFGLQAFCSRCGRCAAECIGGAIDGGTPQELNGQLRWKTTVERCYDVWVRLGSDCGVCLKTCPFS